jgi:hypothetical protein
VVLNLFVEWAPAVIVESFTFSILMIVALIIALMAARAILQVLYQRLGTIRSLSPTRRSVLASPHSMPAVMLEATIPPGEVASTPAIGV